MISVVSLYPYELAVLRYSDATLFDQLSDPVRWILFPFRVSPDNSCQCKLICFTAIIVI